MRNSQTSTLLKYKERLSQSQQERDLTETEFRVSSARLQLQADLLATKQSLATKKIELEELKNAFPLNVQAVINKKIEIEGLEDGISRIEELESELF